MEVAKAQQADRDAQPSPPPSSLAAPSPPLSSSSMGQVASAVWNFSPSDVDGVGGGVFSTSRSPLPSSGLGGTTTTTMPNSVAVKMLRTEMDAQMKTILGLKDKVSTHEEMLFEEQAKNYELTEAVRREKNAKKEVEDTCTQLQDMLKSVRGHFEDSEEKSSQRQNRVSKIVEETRRQVSDKDEEIASLKAALKDEMEKRSALEAAKTKALAKQELADYYFGELVQRTNERESMERALMSAEERRARNLTAVRVQSETWGDMERRGHELKASLDATRSELRAAKLQNLTSKRDVSALEEALVEARMIAGRMEAFSAHLTQEMEGKRRGESGYFRHGDGPTATSKLIKALAEKSRAKVTRLMRAPMNMVGSGGSPLGSGGRMAGGKAGLLMEKGADRVDVQRQAGLIRELTEKLRDSEFRVASLELAREMDTQQRTRLENIVEDLQNGVKGLQLERVSVWSATQHQQSLSSLALRELDALRRELSAIGSRDADRMAQVKEMEYVAGALEAMSEDQDGAGRKRDKAGILKGLGHKKESELGKDIAFFKPLVREELAYTVDELVLLNERLHVSFNNGCAVPLEPFSFLLGGAARVFQFFSFCFVSGAPKFCSLNATPTTEPSPSDLPFFFSFFFWLLLNTPYCIIIF